MKKVSIFAFLLLTFSLCLVVNAENIYKYGPTVVALSGKMVSKMFYGPPNFGGTPKEDQKDIEYILVLEHPITVIADKNDEVNETHAGEKEIQIVNLSGKSIKNFLDQRIIITGTLFSAINGSHHTNVLITLNKIEDIKKY